MDFTVLEKSVLFHGIHAKDLRETLESVPHHIQCYDKDETIFHLMETANRLGVILEGRAEAQKPFPNGSQINVSIRNPGEMIGPAAVFSTSQKYPCDVVAVEPLTLLMFRKEDLMQLMQKDVRILENFTTEIASATYMLSGVTAYTNQISSLENAAAAGHISEADKLSQIGALLQDVTHSQSTTLLLVMVVLPCALLVVSYVLYLKHYKLDEPEYDRICGELKKRREEKI